MCKDLLSKRQPEIICSDQLLPQAECLKVHLMAKAHKAAYEAEDNYKYSWVSKADIAGSWQIGLFVIETLRLHAFPT